MRNTKAVRADAGMVRQTVELNVKTQQEVMEWIGSLIYIPFDLYQAEGICWWFSQ